MVGVRNDCVGRAAVDRIFEGMRKLAEGHRLPITDQFRDHARLLLKNAALTHPDASKA